MINSKVVLPFCVSTNPKIAADPVSCNVRR